MKKTISLLSIITAVIITSLCVFAGDVPESLLGQDGSKVFIGTIESFTVESADEYSSQAEIKSIDVIPTQKIKGDVEIGVKETYTRCDSVLMLEKGKEYLFGYIDENNFYIYEIESKDENSIVLVDSDKHDMTKRLEDYLNGGVFARAEQERSSIGSQISFSEFLGENLSYVEKVTLRYQDELHEVNKDEFLQIAEDIKITNVKNDALHDVKENANSTDTYKSVLYIELFDENDNLVCFGAVSRYGEIDRYSLFMSRLMQKDYEMTAEDLSRLYSLLPENVRENMLAPENLPINAVTLPLELPADPIVYEQGENDYIGFITGAIGIAIIIAIAVIFKACKKKQK